MGAFSFVCGSAAGAVLAWLANRRDMSRRSVAAYTGVCCGLLGMVLASSHGATAPMSQAGIGFLGAAAPLTMCTTAGPVVRDFAAVLRISLTLAIALAYGIGCATMGFALIYGVRHPPQKVYVRDAANHWVLPW